ncbi:MAG: DUF262 domain-containing protein [Bacteroidaceae bacterium]|nr:DUF262 domain-containing protein [Bacteroidaceae bacterium]
MENYAKTPERIAKEGEQFTIPIYQRLYTWTPEEIKTLLEDLYEQYSVGGHYYIGLLTATDSNELVDGQQRFCAMTLMAIAMKEKYLPWEKFLLSEDGQQRLKFTARKEDEEYLKSKIDERHQGQVVKNDYMEAGLESIRDFLKESIKTDEERIDFSKYVYEHLAFFIQKLPEGYTGRMLNKYFESMNSTGRNLENHEILKVDMLQAANIGENKKEEYDRLVTMWNMASRMNQTILPFYDEEKKKNYSIILSQIQSNNQEAIEEEIIKKALEQEPTKPIIDILNNPPTDKITKNGRIQGNMYSFLKFSDFLLQVLFIVLKEQEIEPNNKQKFFKPENLRKTFKEYQDYYEPKSFIEELFKYRIILDWVIIRIDGEGEYNLGMAKEEYSRLEQYEAMLFSSTSRDTYYKWIPFLLESVMRGNCDEKALLVALKEHDNQNNPFENRDLYYKDYDGKGFDNYIFRRLDYYIWEDFTNNLNIDDCIAKYFNRTISPHDYHELKRIISSFKFHQYNSVEHLHPRTETIQNDKWVLDENDEEGKQALHGFGNLALVSPSFNSSQSNDALDRKFGNIRDYIIKRRVDSIKLAIMYYEADGKSELWSNKVSKLHGEKMFSFLKSTYSI